MSISDRKKKILAAVVDEYIRTAEPVGSKAIAQNAGLGCSPATIRNELAELVSMGYLEQPHTSAGRVPTPMGYRMYVNELMEKQKLSLEETEEMNSRLNSKLQELDVTSVSGEISVYAANAGEISLSTTSGSISGSVRTQKLEADSGSGSIDLALDIMPTELEAETSSGSIVMQLCDLSTLPSPLPVEFKTTSGKLCSDVTFTTAEDAAWEFQTVSGNVELLTVR